MNGERHTQWCVLLFTAALSCWVIISIFVQSGENTSSADAVRTSTRDESPFYQTYHPWPEDAHCRHLNVKRNLRPNVFLVSFPDSGSGWARQFLENATGFHVCDYQAKVADGSYGVPVLLLRNPIDVAIIRHHRHYGDSSGRAPTSAFDGPSWNAMIRNVSNEWADHTVGWIQRLNNTGTVIFLERLSGREAVQEMERLVGAVGLVKPVDYIRRLRCALKHRYDDWADRQLVNQYRIIISHRPLMPVITALHRVQSSLRRHRLPVLPSYDLHILDESV